MQINTEQLIDFINRFTENGVPISINDEVAIKSIVATGIITAIGTFIATYYATKATSKNTIELFKEQEKMRIREDLRLDFYKKYKKIYDKLQNKIREVDIDIYSFDERLSISFEDEYDKSLEEILKYTVELDDHYQLNKRILNKKYDYFEKDGKINKIYSCYTDYCDKGNAWDRLESKKCIKGIKDDLEILNDQIEDDFISKYFK